MCERIIHPVNTLCEIVLGFFVSPRDFAAASPGDMKPNTCPHAVATAVPERANAIDMAQLNSKKHNPESHGVNPVSKYAKGMKARGCFWMLDA